MIDFETHKKQREVLATARKEELGHRLVELTEQTRNEGKSPTEARLMAIMTFLGENRLTA